MDIRDLLLEHEGLRLKPYLDTVGKLTLGCGRNLDDNGITEDEALFMLNNDIDRVTRELDAVLPYFNTLNDARKACLIDMCFNLGLSRFLGFRRMLAAAARGNYDEAAREALDSRWAQQVGRRAERLAEMMRSGEWR